jgi:hypothetical protein
MFKKYGRGEHSLRKLKSSAFPGDVSCLRVFYQVVIVLCSSSTKDLLEKRGKIYSERPSLPILEMYTYHYHPITRQDNSISWVDVDWFLASMGGAREEAY